MAFRVRSSKFRHVFGNAVKKEHCYDCIKITKNAHDSNYCAVNPKFVAVVTESAGGGAFLILPLERVRKTSCVYVLNFLPSANEVAARNPPGQTLPPLKQTATTADDSNYCAVNPKFGYIPHPTGMHSCFVFDKNEKEIKEWTFTSVAQFHLGWVESHLT